eukprot:jgi/Phyca11/129180/e_gw1.82.104.1
MVRARQKQVRDADVTSSDLSWRSVWRELKDQGWTNKRPSSRGLDDRYRYVRPGCNPDGAEGVDVFLGEKAVLEYYANSKVLYDSTEYAAMDSGEDAEKDDLVMDEDSGEDSECADIHIPADEDESEASETEIAAEEPDTFDYMNKPYEPVDNTRSYPGLRQGYSGPTADALRNADSPLALFFFFLPVVLWQHIAVCSNEYGREMAPLRVDERHKRYRSKFRLNPQLPKKSKRDIQTELEGVKPIQPHELVALSAS